MSKVIPFRTHAPGILLSLAVAGLALLGDFAERFLVGEAWLEALVLAILLGAAIRLLLPRPASFDPGIEFSAKYFLEIAIVLLGAGVSAAALASIGPAMLGAIAFVVFCVLAASYGIGRLLGLPKRMAVLVACGNSICGNSAIAAAAPVIHAQSDDVASSVAFTAVLGVLTVLLLPLLVPVLDLSSTNYGILAGMTVYAVPQVFAATVPVSAVSAQVGMLVKLVRVLMLGPVVVTLSLIAASRAGAAGCRPPLYRLVPWFIVGFLLMLAARSAGLIGEPVAMAMNVASGGLTVVAMAALGLGVDIRKVMQAGMRVSATVILSLIVLLAASYAMILLLQVTAP
ncbi:putative sulfate exporter family transporter [Rhizobium sp. ARZ01]|uniref:YeiH family protein n=1 Tax=Rhizobium sp. ARZ01 TaxID=2769313 RepID=UPI00177CF73E|nr:putative sulfate exporter family transporter [Rhizobium sp. ARZ01]MBD9374665.1 putative sulfate exporter family transporter [Rhizobium sp. ARZ01]